MTPPPSKLPRHSLTEPNDDMTVMGSPKRDMDIDSTSSDNFDPHTVAAGLKALCDQLAVMM